MSDQGGGKQSMRLEKKVSFHQNLLKLLSYQNHQYHLLLYLLLNLGRRSIVVMNGMMSGIVMKMIFPVRTKIRMTDINSQLNAVHRKPEASRRTPYCLRLIMLITYATHLYESFSTDHSSVMVVKIFCWVSIHHLFLKPKLISMSVDK
ncbi:unnamed protein product [Schistosoma curassoni]|uniref:Ovule protein n=1 Tax=Schistosoma curassoni TaxID=6186 RepID=A0A183KL80_9TREM|nr:unnamed protein product [Schistosoma curassoni]